MQSQNEQIKAHLEAGNSITALDALRMFNCLRLSGRIHDLKEEGLPINSQIIKTETGKHIAEYSLKS